MNDGQRKYPVDYFFLHHSVGPDFVNASDLEVQDWYSNNGKARAYNNGAINPMHEHPSRPGQLTYAQAQFTLREYTKDGNKYGWRLTDLIARPWQNVAWAVGNWDYNVKSSSVEICGNYVNKTLPDKALMCLADFLRQIDNELGGSLKVWLHKEVYATACPGQISSQRDKLVDMINNPAKWNATLFPVAPAPVITKKNIVSETVIPFEKKNITDPTSDVTKVTQIGVNGKRTVTHEVTYTDGIEASRRLVSDVTKDPITEITTIGTFIPAPTPDPTPEPSNPFVVFLEWLLGLIKSIWNKEK